MDSFDPDELRRRIIGRGIEVIDLEKSTNRDIIEKVKKIDEVSRKIVEKRQEKHPDVKLSRDEYTPLKEIIMKVTREYALQIEELAKKILEDEVKQSILDKKETIIDDIVERLLEDIKFNIK